MFKGQYHQKDLFFTGDIHCLFNENIRLTGKGKGRFFLEGYPGYKIEALEDFTFCYDEKILVEDANFLVSYKNKKIADLSTSSIDIDKNYQKISLHGICGDGETSFIQKFINIHIVDEKMRFSGEADIVIADNDFLVTGTIHENKYQINGYEFSIDKVNVRGNKKSCVLDFKMPVYDSLIKFSTNVFFDEKIIFHIQGYENDLSVLEVDGNYLDKINLLRIKGDLLGLEFDITPFVELGKTAYQTDININFQKLKPLLCEDLVEVVDKYQLNSGVKILGKATYDQNLEFDGMIKGKDFDLIGYSCNTMYGDMIYKDQMVSVKNFSIADRSFLCRCDEATFNMKKGGCYLLSPKIKIQNLRPCLLSKRGERKKLTNPLMFPSIDFLDIKGNLANVDTLTGNGTIKFINSFDREINPVFNFAKEIIGRIGLDPVLMVPIIGELDFNIYNGKMNFSRMYNSFSENERSYFYLWNKTQSYIDFDGNIQIDVRMKQHVLFRFTELFIISIDGTLSSPNIFLK